MSDRVDIVVTGTGAITALGFGVEVNVAALARDGTGIHAADGVFAACAPVEPPYLRCDVPAELESQIKFLNPSSQMGATAAVEAVGRDVGPHQRQEHGLIGEQHAPCTERRGGQAARPRAGSQLKHLRRRRQRRPPLLEQRDEGACGRP